MAIINDYIFLDILYIQIIIIIKCYISRLTIYILH